MDGSSVDDRLVIHALLDDLVEDGASFDTTKTT